MPSTSELRSLHQYLTEPFQNEKSVNLLVMNNIAQFIRMAGAENEHPGGVPFETNGNRTSIASEIISRTKERKQMDSRVAKSPYSSKYSPKRNTAAFYKPTSVRNSSFVHKGRHQSRRSIPGKSETRRKSIDCVYAVNTQSTKVYSIEDRTLIYEENTDLGSNANHDQDKNGTNNTLPPLTTQFDNLTLQTKKYRLQNLKERKRSLSGQSANKVCNEKMPLKNLRSASVDHTNHQKFFKEESSSSSFVSGPYSQLNGNLNSPSWDVRSNDIRSKPNSVQSAFSTNQTKGEKLHRSLTMPEMLDSSKKITVDNLSPSNALGSGRRSKRGVRSSSVYSPISVSSIEKSKSSSKPYIARRRASLPTSSLAISTLTSETSRSREFSEALHEMKHQRARVETRQVERPSSPPSTRREVLHRIEEVHPEASADASRSKAKDTDKSETKDTKDTMHTPNNAKRSDDPTTALPLQNGKNSKPHFPNTEEENDKGVVQEDQIAQKVNKTSVFDISEDLADSKKIFSRLENKKHISNNEQNQHFVVENDEEELKVESPCLLLTAASAYDTDFIDNSVVFKEDDDLCDEDFHEKRLILWLMDVSTGDDAETVTRITPPPSPDPSTQESAIRVVYGED